MKCVLFGCRENAIGQFTWGYHTLKKENTKQPLCQLHSTELWERITHSVSAGGMIYFIDPIDETKQ